MRTTASHTEARLLQRLQWRLALGFAAAFVIFDILVVGLTYVVLEYHFVSEAKSTITTVWRKENAEPSPEHDEIARPTTPQARLLPGEDLPRVVSWQFGPDGQFIPGPAQVYGLPIGVSAILPNRQLLKEMPHTRTPLWAVVEYQQYRVLVGSRPLWRGSRYLGAEQSVYSMGRLEVLMRGLIVVDLELSAVVIVLIILMAFWLSGRALHPIRLALRRQRDFIHDVSHELRTPLTIVKSSLELALAEPQRGEVDQAIRSTLEEVDYVTRLMSDLAMLARIDSGTTLIEPEVFDLFQVAEDVVSGLKPLALERQVDLTLSTSGPDGNALGDPVKIRQLLLILLDNALKYNHPGGRAAIVVEIRPQSVHLMVENTGHGIPPDDLPHVFNRFYRSRATNRQAPGSGLGLAIADWIVKAHRGSIRAESEMGKGTRFWVDWPSHWER